MNVGSDSEDSMLMKECKHSHNTKMFCLVNQVCTVYRVHWLRAKARRDRWAEEKLIVRHEMDWTVLYFVRQAEVWVSRMLSADEVTQPGHRCYAARQVNMWKKFAEQAKDAFGRVAGPITV